MIGAACIFPSLLNCACTGLNAGFSAPFSPFDAKAKRKLRKWNQNLRGLPPVCSESVATEAIFLGGVWLQKPIVSAIGHERYS